MFKTIVKRCRLGSHRARANRQPIYSRRFALETLEPRFALNGTWTALAPSNPAAGPTGTQALMLLSDGTVMVQQGQNAATNAWDKLSPNAAGSYVNGAWSPLAPMNLARAVFTTAVLPDGRVIAVGGEYYTPANLKFTNTAEMYDPLANSWTNLPSVPTPTPMGECPSAVLPDGRILVSDKRGDTTYLYTPATNSWSAAPDKLRGDWTDEETWVKLPDNSVVSYDIWSSLTDNTFHAQRYVPDSNGGAGQWVDASNVDPTNPPSLLSSADAGHEIGPAFLQADGNVIQFGALGNTAIYSPASDMWSAGPAEPSVVINGTSQQLVATDDPGAMLPNGNILITLSPQDSSINSTYVYEYNPVAQTYTDVTPSGGINNRDWLLNMVMLPSGQVLMGNCFGGMQVYTPSGAAPSAAQPVITNLVSNGNGAYTLTGTQLNGISEGANYGDDFGVASNYPIVQFTDSQGHVFYGRTSNWSNTGVATGGTPVTTNFTSPAFMPYGTYSLSVIANGIASNPVPFTGGVVGPSADLAVTDSGPTSSSEGNNVTYSLTVTNNGPTNATNVVLKDTLGANFKYVAATKGQGTVSQSGSVVTFSLGSVAVGQTVIATVTAQATEDGNLTNAASATSSLSDANLLNNSAVATTAVAELPVNVSGPITLTGKKQNNVTVATFTHAGGLEPAGDFIATINWGDGATSTGSISLSRGTYSVKGSHTYSANGSYTVTTTVVESESGSGALMALALGSSGTALAATVPQTPSMTLSTEQSLPTSRVAALAREQVFAAFASDQNDAPLQRGLWKADSNTERDDWKLADGADDDPTVADLALTADLASDI